MSKMSAAVATAVCVQSHSQEPLSTSMSTLGSNRWGLGLQFFRFQHNRKKKKKVKQQKQQQDDDDHHHLDDAMRLHERMVERIRMSDTNSTSEHFAKSCQDRWDQLELGGQWPFLDTISKMPTLTLQQEFVLSKTSPSGHPIRVIDNVLPLRWCKSIIETTEQIGFGRVPTPQNQQHERTRTKNTSELVQLDSPELADYIWNQIHHKFLPESQEGVPSHGLIKHLQVFGTTYEKRGILPTIRFMKYNPSQQFEAHIDPQRLVSEFDVYEDVDENNENADDGEGNNCHRRRIRHRRRRQGIFRSLFTVAIYLNDLNDSFDHRVADDDKSGDEEGNTTTATTTACNPGCGGGNLNFVERTADFSSMLSVSPTENHNLHFTQKIQRSIQPKAGRCVVFRHDEVHEAGRVTAGTKYMLQCDVLYECVFNKDSN